ncbi:hypothetical protein [uncultured Moraxella sp.]|uniref:hypothetical protein n=1 Tax=uncultured Moraxella sp. TaxID=263769 RepID=UPI0025EAA766|nr:hypothetical protein [uncultured Moraxella sp.]
MALSTKVIAPFLGASVIAGEGVYDEIAQGCVIGLADELGFADLDAAVASEVDKIAAMDDDAFDEYLAEAAEAVADQEAVLLICLNVLAADGVISVNELANYFAFADVLEVSEDRASEIFDDFVDAMDDLVIEDEE